MNEKIVSFMQVPEESTGFATYMFFNTNTSDLRWVKTSGNYENIQILKNEIDNDDILFPTSHEENFLNNNLIKFYKKKGIEIT